MPRYTISESDFALTIYLKQGIPLSFSFDMPLLNASNIGWCPISPSCGYLSFHKSYLFAHTPIAIG